MSDDTLPRSLVYINRFLEDNPDVAEPLLKRTRNIVCVDR